MTEPSTFCSSCKRPIWWARTRNGRSLPLDPEPVPGGNVTIDAQGFAHVLTKAELAAPPDGPHFVSHFATCEFADRHRKRPGG